MLTLIIFLVLIALLFGGIGIAVDGLAWLAIIGIVLLLAGGGVGLRNRR